MKAIQIIAVMQIWVLVFATVQAQNKSIMQEKESIKKTLLLYRDALNSSNTEAVLQLYAADGVFMPAAGPTAIGSKQLKEAYDFVFSNIQLNIEFYIEEIEVVGAHAFARTSSKGTTLVHATNASMPEENRELFVLKKNQGNWEIDRYMFNKKQ